MKKNKQILSFEEGEKGCCVCNTPLPAHDTWPGARYPSCGSPECGARLKESKPACCEGKAGLSAKVGLYIGPNERKCDAYGCENFIREGRYDARNALHACSSKCWVKINHRCEVYVCGCGCGTSFRAEPDPRNKEPLRFLNKQHHATYQKEKYLLERAGTFLPVVREFLDGFAKQHYGAHFGFNKIGPFFEFLGEAGITSLEDVTPRTITSYLSWATAKGEGYGTCAGNVTYLSTFFNWLIASELRRAANPVVNLMHYQKKPVRLPRPLMDAELDYAWELLNQRGNARLRLAAAIAQEAGLRISEICRLKVDHVDAAGMRLFVALPNKGSEEAWVNFSEGTKKALEEWLKERDPDCEHDYLLHSKRLKPCNLKSLSREFSAVTCKEYGGKVLNENGFEEWRTHRLRHTLASTLAREGADANLIMAQGRWKTASSMNLYTRVDMDKARRDYDAAMKSSRERRHTSPRKKKLSIEQLFEYVSKAS